MLGWDGLSVDSSLLLGGAFPPVPPVPSQPSAWDRFVQNFDDRPFETGLYVVAGVGLVVGGVVLTVATGGGSGCQMHRRPRRPQRSGNTGQLRAREFQK